MDITIMRNLPRWTRSVSSILRKRLGTTAIIALLTLASTSAARAGDLTLTVSWDNLNPAQTGIVRVVGDGDAWRFGLALEGVVMVGNPVWDYPTKSGANPAWGAWAESPFSVTWSGTPVPFAFSVSVSGDIRRSNGGGGTGTPGDEEIRHFNATWGGTVQVAKIWTAGDPILVGDLSAAPVLDGATMTVDPGSAVTFTVTASDQDHWTSGIDSGDGPDIVTYSWSASGGQMPGSRSSSAATWIAPTKGGDYNIICTVDDAVSFLQAPDTGTRDDNKVTKSCTVHVPYREWTSGLLIGEEAHKQSDGSNIIIKSGRIITPQDQRSGNVDGFLPEQVVVALDDVFSCGVEQAVDTDHWIQGNKSGDEADSIPVTNYVWSGGDGVNSGFVTGWTIDEQGHRIPILATTVTGMNATYKAPHVPGTITISCTIDDLPGVVNAPESGSRDDAAQVHAVSVDVANFDSYAKLRLYRVDSTQPDGLGNEVCSGVVGGALVPVVEVKVGSSRQLDPSTKARLWLEESSPLHGLTDNHTCYNDILGGVWQLWNGTAWEIGGTPQDQNTDLDAKLYRKVLPIWYTTQMQLYTDPDGPSIKDGDGQVISGGMTFSVLYGHNGAHRLLLADAAKDAPMQLIFHKKVVDETGVATWTESFEAGPTSLALDCENLNITSAATGDGNESYFRFDPSSDDAGLLHPSINFSFTNDGDGASSTNRYHWWLWLRGTDINGTSSFITYEGYKSEPGSQTVNINTTEPNAPYTYDQVMSQWGTYCFDLHVLDTKTGDWQGIRSDKISIPAAMTDGTGAQLLDNEGKVLVDAAGNPRAGHSIDPWTDGTSYQYRASYVLNGERDATEMTIQLLDPKLSVRSTIIGGTAVDHPYLDRELFALEDSDPDGIYKGIFVARDAFYDQYRDHRNKLMLAVNSRHKPPVADNYHWMDDNNVKTRYLADKIAASFQLKAGYRANARGAVTPRIDEFRKHFSVDSIAFEFGHGLLEGGVLNPHEGSGLAAHQSTIFGSHHIYFMNTMTTQAKLVLYLTCDSGATNSRGHGNLLDETCNSGADMAIGFTSTIDYVYKTNFQHALDFIFNGDNYCDITVIWIKKFWTDTCQGDYDYADQKYKPITVANALARSAAAIMESTGSYYGYNNYSVRAKGGSADVTIAPAG